MKKSNETMIYQRQERFGSRKKGSTPKGMEIISFYNSDALTMSRYIMDEAGDAKVGTLEVEFARRTVSGSVKRYRYFNVPHELIMRVNSSHSVGATFNELITLNPDIKFVHLDQVPAKKEVETGTEAIA